jgi:hypothetical protein
VNEDASIAGSLIDESEDLADGECIGVESNLGAGCGG